MKKSVSILISALMLLSLFLSLPVFAVGVYDAPAGYSEHDYQKLVAILEQTDDSGIKNGVKISPSYDPEDPETWYDAMEGLGAVWTDEPVKRLNSFCYYEHYVSGQELAMYGNLDLSGCSGLEDLYVDSNRLSEVNVTDCLNLRQLVASYNSDALVWFDGCASLEQLHIAGTNMKVVDTSCLPHLKYIDVSLNDILELDFTQNTELEGIICYCSMLRSLNIAGLESLVSIECTVSYLTELDLTGCSSLRGVNVDANAIESILLTGCSSLTSLHFEANHVADIDLSDCPELSSLNCAWNLLDSLDVTCCPNLRYLACNGNYISELDLTNCPELYTVYIHSNPIKYLDLSNAQYIGFNTIAASGNGYVGVETVEEANWHEAIATPADGETFLGWYDTDGNLLGTDRFLSTEQMNYGDVTARFTGSAFIMGDVNGDGSVTSADALLVLRFALDLVSDLPNPDAADVNGTGNVDSSDALIILRMSMGA